MPAPTTATPTHYYDTTQRRILCGLRGIAHRSTKHSRGVTCAACVGMLGQGRTPSLASGAGAAS